MVSDTPQALGDLFERYGVVFTNPDTFADEDDDPMTRECSGCLAEAGEPCRPGCLSRETQLLEHFTPR